MLPPYVPIHNPPSRDSVTTRTLSSVEWLKRAPFGGGTEVEIRPIFEMEDFGAEYTPELRAQEERQRAAMAQQQNK